MGLVEEVIEGMPENAPYLVVNPQADAGDSRYRISELGGLDSFYSIGDPVGLDNFGDVLGIDVRPDLIVMPSPDRESGERLRKLVVTEVGGNDGNYGSVVDARGYERNPTGSKFGPKDLPFAVMNSAVVHLKQIRGV